MGTHNNSTLFPIGTKMYTVYKHHDNIDSWKPHIIVHPEHECLYIKPEKTESRHIGT